MKQKSNYQAQITTYSEEIKYKNKCARLSQNHGISKEDKEKQIQSLNCFESSNNSDDLDAIFEEFQHDKANDENKEFLSNDNDEDDNIEDMLTPEEELEEAIRDPSKRSHYIEAHYKFDSYSGNYSYYKCTELKYIDGKLYQYSYRNRYNIVTF